ncbi:MAG: pilus assembly protein CpaF [Nocardioides sp.]|uniref:CpaF family protein n=1 Tax=Nocardioides sp. TaxID=35761 RepID=UPI002603035D|nr:CpaF family protein [Nocardioides sp.]MCW2834005.1 pilus assembly protein CpaF [Nocardioides sp.]
MSLSDRIAAAQRSRTSSDAPAPPREPAQAAAGVATGALAAPAGAPPGARVATPRAAAPQAAVPPSVASNGSGTTALAKLTATKAAPAGRDPFAEVKRIVHAKLVEALGPKLYDAHMTQSELEQQVHVALQIALADADQPMSSVDRARVSQEIADDILGYGPLEPLLRDGDLSEVMVNSFDSIYIERKGKLVKTDFQFADEAHLRRTIDKIVSKIGRRVDETSPMVDARLPDGSRVNAIIPPLALDGSKLTIRKFSEDPYTIEDLISFNSISRQGADLLQACVKGRLNILVSGGTGSGKTTTLNVLSSFIPSDERIVTIEDAAELRLHQDHVLRLESRPSNIEGKGAVTIRDLVKNSLRMRPDRIVVGEIRDAAALDMLQAMNTGHDGSISTLHANTPRDALSRLETMVLMAGMDLPMRAIREQVASAVDLIIQQTRLKDGTRRITAITEIVGMEGEIITTHDVFLFDYSAGTDENGKFQGQLKSMGLRPRFIERLIDHGVKIDPAIFATPSGLR